MKDILINNHEFEYLSYDHIKALSGFERSYPKQFNELIKNRIPIDCHIIPEEIKKRHSYWRKGKLRSIRFNPNGTIRDFKIGARYAKTFTESDFNKTFRLINQ